MRRSRIKAKLGRGQSVLVTTLHLMDPSVFELASIMGFDGLWIDLEHSGRSLETATGLMRAARVGSSDILARPAKGEWMRMARLLEAGAQGIIYPRCDDAAEARQVVRWAKFAPLGERGVDGGQADAPYCMMPLVEYLAAANRETFIVIQVEQQEAVDQVDEIAAVEGVDVIMLGPADFTVLSGIPGKFDDPLVRRAYESIAAAARRHGKAWGAPSGTPEQARMLLEMGALFIAHQADILMIKNGLDQIQRNFAPLGFGFEQSPAY